MSLLDRNSPFQLANRAYKKTVFLLKKNKSRKITRQILSSIPEEKNDSDLIYIYSPHRSDIREEFYSLLIRELSKRKIDSYFLASGTMYDYFKPRLKYKGLEVSNSLLIDGFPTSFKSKIFNAPSFDWKSNMDRNEFFIDGINFFPIIKSSLTSANKRFNFDFSEPEIARQIEAIARSCDILLNYFYTFQKITKEEGKKIRIIITQFIDLPNSIFKFLSDHFKSEDVQCITALPGLNKYYFRSKANDWYLVISNLNKRKLEIGVEVSRQQLESVKNKNHDIESISQSIEKAITRPVENCDTGDKDRILELIKDYKQRGKRVFVLFGHLFYDMAVIDASPVFNDLCEWIAKTVDYFNGKGDLLLLKPHTAEISRNPKETLESFIASLKIGPNVQILKPSTFSLFDISKLMDCGLIWTSSVAMELTYLGIPSIIAGTPVYKSLELCYAKSQADYFDKIENCNQIKVSENQKKDIVYYTYYLEKMQSYYLGQINGVYWNHEEVKKYLKHGDEHVDKLVDAFLNEA